MTFDDDAKLSGRGVSRSRGRTGAIAGGGGILGLIAIVLVSNWLGVDLTPLLGGGTGTGSQTTDSPLANCTTGADANNNIDCRIQGAYDSLDAYWSDEAASLGVAYHAPEVRLFTGSTSTGCGSATSAVGPFYCPADEIIYLDTAFYDDLKTRFGATGGPLAQLYVVAHEYGHHIQNLSGTFDKVDQRATGAASGSVRLELQADCFAGAWAAAASSTTDSSGTPLLKPITQAQVNDALNAASVIGDDRIQQKAGGAVNPETWTHGSSAQRQRWFLTGYSNGAKACNTFAVSASRL